MAQQEFLDGRGPALTPDVLVLEQDAEPLGSLGMAACRV